MSGALLSTLGLALSAIFHTNISVLYLTYGLMFGVGIALAYAPPMGVAMAWYPRKKGLVNGIIVGGFGMGAFIFNTVQTTYLNPLNLSPREDGYFSADQTDILDRVPSVFLLLGSIYTVMQLLAVLLISSPGEEDLSSNIPLVTQIEEQEEDVLYQTGSAASSPVTEPQAGIEINIKPSDIVKTREFWVLWVTFVLNTQVGDSISAGLCHYE